MYASCSKGASSDTMPASLHVIAELLALRFLDSLAEGTVVCLLATAVLHIAPRQNAATRFALWFSALVAIAAFPWIGWAWSHDHISQVAARHAAITLPHSWAIYFLALWCAVAAWFGTGVVRALWHLHVLRRNCIPVDFAELSPVLQETLQRHGANRNIPVCTSDDVRVPTAVGLLKPAILVPTWVMRELSPVELNQILLHELAHFRRWDDWTNLAQQVVKALFFFHPAVWWIDGKVSFEREMACDDAVLAETHSPRAYAECLAHLAEMSFVNRSIALAQAALGKIRQTSARVAQILDVNRPAGTSRHCAAAVSLVAVLAAGCGAFHSKVPKLIAFGSETHASQMQTAAVSATPLITESARPPLVPVIQAKWNSRVVTRPPLSHEQPTALRSKSLKPRQNTLVHLTGSKVSTVPVTETIWVVVETGGENPAAPHVYQIQMLRLTVLRTVFSAPSHQVPRNET